MENWTFINWLVLLGLILLVVWIVRWVLGTDKIANQLTTLNKQSALQNMLLMKLLVQNGASEAEIETYVVEALKEIESSHKY